MVSPIDLTTVAAVESWLNQGGTVDAAIIQSAITAYSQFVLTYTARTNLSSIQTYSEVYNGTGSERQQLRNYPIQSVSSLTIGTTVIPQSPAANQTGWVIDSSGNQNAIALRSGAGFVGGAWSAGEWPGRWGAYGNAPPLGYAPYRFVEGIMNVAVTYQAGYTVPGVVSETVPATPGPYTVTVSPWFADQGVLGLTAVTGTPAAGQYSVLNGVYTFNAAQQGQTVVISYLYGGVPFDLNQASTQLVAAKYRSRQWIEQLSQVQPGVGTTAYSRLAIPADVEMVLNRYRMRFLPN
jgi:hypothetical protein